MPPQQILLVQELKQPDLCRHAGSTQQAAAAVLPGRQPVVLQGSSLSCKAASCPARQVVVLQGSCPSCKGSQLSCKAVNCSARLLPVLQGSHLSPDDLSPQILLRSSAGTRRPASCRSCRRSLAAWHLRMPASPAADSAAASQHSTAGGGVTRVSGYRSCWRLQ